MNGSLPPSVIVDRGLVGLGGDGLFADAALHHRDAKRDLDRGRRAGGAGDDAALNADPRGDHAAIDACIRARSW